jgi:hypothetical protein
MDGSLCGRHVAFQVARTAAVRSRRERHMPAPATVVTVDRAVWAEAMRISQGRLVIRIVDANTVIVTNTERYPRG